LHRSAHSAVIVVWGDPEPALLADVDPARAGVDHMPLTPSLFGAVGGGEVSWTFVPGPSMTPDPYFATSLTRLTSVISSGS
jgi:hypothetical protein